jgi:uncharacterized protein (DUF1330 family)
MAVNPSGDALNEFVSTDPDEPVVMLNLLRFAAGGRESYAQYSRAMRGLLDRYGARVLYAGDGQSALVAEDGQAWDAVLLVHYPSRHAFSRMISDPEYQQVTHLRAAALQEAVLQPTRPW